MTDTRTAFEAHFQLSQRQAKRDNAGEYIDEKVRDKWEGWQAKPENPWISVSGRLPEFNDPVWLYEPQRGTFVGGRVDHGDEWLWGNSYGTHYDRSDGTWDATSLECDDDYQPTHWMPLPTPPKGR